MKYNVVYSNNRESLVIKYYKTKDSKLINQIMIMNLDIVEHVIKYIDSDLTYDELFCYGLEVLYIAIKTFNPNLGSFLNYSPICIKNKILREIAREENIGINFFPTFYRAKRIVEKEKDEKLFENNNLIDEIFEYMLKNKMVSTNSYEEHKSKILLKLKNYIDDYLLLDYKSLSCEIEYNDIKERIDNILNIFEPRIKEIIKLYYGFNDNKCLTYNELAVIFKISKSRIGQIINESLEILRNSSYYEELSEYLSFFDNYKIMTKKKTF